MQYSEKIFKKNRRVFLGGLYHIYPKKSHNTMDIYRAPVESYKRLLKTFHFVDDRFDPDTLDALLESMAKFAEEKLLPKNALGDQEGCRYDPDTHAVHVPESFHDLYKEYVEQGYASVEGETRYNGQDFPPVLVLLMAEFMASANMAFSLGPMLTPAACHAISFAGTDEQKSTYLPKMITGTWSGTMCLTEAHCGTDLGLIKTKAEKAKDGYRITGNKIWITYGEHDLTENIIHLVLAKLPDAPSGSKGISMFIVPKYLADGSRNQVRCTGLEKKLGQHGSPTCFMSFDGAEGYLLGKENQGMKNMFVMMNEARIGVGVSGLAMSEIAYQTALSFCKERRQSRSLDPKKQDESHASDCILVHPDVKRQLLEIKSTNMAMRAWVVYAGVLLGSSQKKDQDRVALFTPMIKSFLSERGCENIHHAMQVMGGSGYVKDWRVEQYYRDARISMIYEGTNGIQALDLVGRKLVKDSGQSMRDLIADMRKEADLCEHKDFAQALSCACDDLQKASVWLMQHGMKDPEEAAAVASAYLKISALTVLAFMWVIMIKHKHQDELDVGKYFIEYVLPDIKPHLHRVEVGKAPITDVDDRYL